MSKDGGSAPPESNSNAPADKNDDIYENRSTKKIIRIITVMAYMFAVSSMGVTLSGYYLFLWQPPNPKLIIRTHKLVADPQPQYLTYESPRPGNSGFGNNVSTDKQRVASGDDLLVKTNVNLTHNSSAPYIAGLFMKKLGTVDGRLRRKVDSSTVLSMTENTVRGVTSDASSLDVTATSTLSYVLGQGRRAGKSLLKSNYVGYGKESTENHSSVLQESSGDYGGDEDK